MPIDDPISSLQELNASDERGRSPVMGLAAHFLRVVRYWHRPAHRLRARRSRVLLTGLAIDVQRTAHNLWTSWSKN